MQQVHLARVDGAIGLGERIEYNVPRTASGFHEVRKLPLRSVRAHTCGLP